MTQNYLKKSLQLKSLENVEYLFIDINPRSSMIRGGSSC